MSVLAFDAIQETVADLLDKTEALAGVAIATHKGKTLSESEEALQKDGRAIIVLPVQSGDDALNGLGAARLVARIPVLFMINPETNSSEIASLVKAGTEGVIAYLNPTFPQDRFGVDKVEQFGSDEGVWGYVVTFTKAFQFSTSQA